MKEKDELLSVLRDTRRMLALPENDYNWSSWKDMAAALQEIDGLIEAIKEESAPDVKVLGLLFMATGPIQEVSISSGWGHEFITLSARFDKAFENYKNLINRLQTIKIL